MLLTGASGQLGQALRSRQPVLVHGEPLELMATNRHGSDGAMALDLSDAEVCIHSLQVKSFFESAYKQLLHY